MRRLLGLLVLGIFATTPVAAQIVPVGDYLTRLQSVASQQQVWKEPGWLNLLHYRARQPRSDDSSYSSFVDDSDFFLSETGRDNPETELIATLAGLFNKNLVDDRHPRCRFPARSRWLVSRLGIDPAGMPAARCPLYEQWRDMVDADSVVLVFPAHHLNSPSSMFGHTLLRLDHKQGNNQSDWLSYAVNFGADVPADDNSLLYAFQGLSGGYPGHFIVEPYFKKIQEYNRDENRDIWEYPLNLTPQETARLVTHLWELKEIDFDYFFFTENCSYRLLELLEIARPGIELTDDFVLTAIPIDTVRSVERAGLITGTFYRRSLASELAHQLDALPSPLYPLIVQLADDVSAIQSELFRQLSAEQQYRVLRAAYQASRYHQGSEARDQSLAKNSLALLAEINRYPVKPTGDNALPVAPELSHQSKRLALTVGRDAEKNFAEVKFRMGYHSLLDNNYGFLKGAQINMGDTAIRFYESGNVSLERLDVADVFSLTPKDLFFDSPSWRVYGGLERVNVGQQRPLATHVTGGVGYALSQHDSTFYALVNARLEHNRYFDEPLAAGLGGQLGWLHESAVGNGSVVFSGLKFGGGEHRLALEMAQNIVVSVNSSFRLSAQRRWYDHHTGSEVSFGYHVFFR